MPRPKTLSDEAVLEATARVLLRLGPARFTLADVAQQAGLSPATLVQRFGGKRGLMLAFARSAASRAGVPFEAARRKAKSPLAALRLALVHASKDLSSRREIANSLAVLLDDLTDDDMRAAAVQHAQATQHAIRGLLDAAVAAGELRKADTKALALSVQAAWNGAIIQWALRDAGSFDAFLKRVLAPLLPTHKTGKA